MVGGRVSRRLAAVEEQSAADRGTQLNPLVGEASHKFESSDAIDDHDLHVSIVVGTGLNFLLGSAVETILEANKVRGPARLEKIETAMRYLEQERREIGRGR